MAVLVLMYHRTPPVAGHCLDVAMPLFREQIQTLKTNGVRFIPFDQGLEPRFYGDETVVSITFDDGHRSNLDAMAFLHDVGIPCTSFFISDYVRFGEPGFMNVADFKHAAEYCEVGGHGATHANLARLPPGELREELLSSKAYLEELSGRRVVTMSAPGGAINRRVTRAALQAGYTIIGDSKPVINYTANPQLHRICIQNGQSPESLLSIFQANSTYWLKERMRYHWATQCLKSLVALAIGGNRLARLKRLLSSDQGSAGN